MKSLLGIATLAGMMAAVWSLGCQLPVSDEATVVVQGRILDTDGTPAAGVSVKLYKSAVATLDADWVVGNIVNKDANAFKEQVTDQDGKYVFEFPGDEANSSNQAWAAYFVVYAIDENDPDNQLAARENAMRPVANEQQRLNPGVGGHPDA